MNKFKEIYNNNKEEIKIWEKLPNGCYIGTLNYSDNNVYVLLELLKSFEEQYGEIVDYEAAAKELKLYNDYGKLFIYFDENKKPVSMNGCIYNYENETVDFVGKENINTIYYYGLSTLHSYRKKGACKALIDYSIKFAKENNFDVVYARTDLINSNSEGLMKRAGLEICKYKDDIIAEWVDVTDTKGDFRLHLYMPLKDEISVVPKGNYFLAEDNEKRTIINKKVKILGKIK